MAVPYVVAIVALGLVGAHFLGWAIGRWLYPQPPRPSPWTADDEAALQEDVAAMLRDYEEWKQRNPRVLDDPVVTSHRRDGRPVHTFPRAIPWGGLGRVLDSGWWELRDDASAYDWQHGRNKKGPWE